MKIKNKKIIEFVCRKYSLSFQKIGNTFSFKNKHGVEVGTIACLGISKNRPVIEYLISMPLDIEDNLVELYSEYEDKPFCFIFVVGKLKIEYLYIE